MISVNIPGRGEYHFTHLFLDFNGTIATDGVISDPIKQLLTQLSQRIKIVLLTADTNHSARSQCNDLEIDVHVLDQSGQKAEKARILRETSGDHKIAIGNGSLDEDMLIVADLAICVMGEEGCAASSLIASDIVVGNVELALKMLLLTNRLISSWRL